MRAMIKNVAGQNIYVDLLDAPSLRTIELGLRQGLIEHWDRIWPSTTSSRSMARSGWFKKSSTFDPTTVLVPLQRLGAEQGKSGASVFVGYFMDLSGTYLPSRPVVIKVGSLEKLQIELDNASSWPSHFAGDDSRFAYPFVLAGATGRGVRQRAALIAPFSSEGALDTGQTGWSLKLNDLWQLLHSRTIRNSVVIKQLDAVYELMHGVHRDGRVHCERQIFEYSVEYSWYLRDLHTSAAHIPLTIFGSDPTVEMFGQRWANPVNIVGEILALPGFEGTCGPVHGDLHPKNVVLDRVKQPNIIDFGWAQRRGHVARDYILMELNLRAMTFPSHTPFRDLLLMATRLNPSDDLAGLSPHAQKRVDLIRRVLWSRVISNGIVDDWNKEYLIPMFLVAFGLIKHLDSARSQTSLLATTLGLAQHIDNYLAGSRVRPTTI